MTMEKTEVAKVEAKEGAGTKLEDIEVVHDKVCVALQQLSFVFR
jgi:hypothetical protein